MGYFGGGYIVVIGAWRTVLRLETDKQRIKENC
jgi:hypothetical protein